MSSVRLATEAEERARVVRGRVSEVSFVSESVVLEGAQLSLIEGA